MRKLTQEERVKGQQIWSRMSDLMRAWVMMDVEHRDQRRNCCEPYDCMHHEQCCEECWYCGSCKYGAELSRMTKSVPPVIWMLAEEYALEDARQVVAHELQTIKDLEAVGDYAAAQRIWEGA